MPETLPRPSTIAARLSLFAALSVVLASGPLLADEACPLEMLKNPKLTLSEAYAKAEKDAKAWKADVVPARLMNTTMGPLDAEGRSEAWNFTFASKSANAHVTIGTFRGMYTCTSEKGEFGRLPDLKPGFLVDGARLYALAKENGAALLAKGFIVMVQTAASPETRHATWYINYSDANSKDGGISVILDANTGKVEQVVRH